MIFKETRPTRSLGASTVVMKAVHMVILGYGVVVVIDPGSGPWAWAFYLLILFSVVVMVGTMARFLSRVPFDRPALKRTFSVHEMATFLGSVVLFAPIIGPIAALAIMVLPVLWFVSANLMLFHRPLEPGV